MEIFINELERQLLVKYQELYQKNQPNWAYEMPPAIPVVGNNYNSSKVKVLIYASAENLTYAFAENNQLIPCLEITKQENKFLRGRNALNNSVNTGTVFPNVHIQPINDGSLLSVVKFILKTLNFEHDFSNAPFEFIEQIAVANFGKFSLKPKDPKRRNIDYAGKFSLLEDSFDYIKSDLQFLKPGIIIIPKTIFNTIKKKNMWKNIVKESGAAIEKTILIYQTNPGVINRHIAKQIESKISNSELKDYRKILEPWPESEKVKNLEKYYFWFDINKESLILSNQ